MVCEYEEDRELTSSTQFFQRKEIIIFRACRILILIMYYSHLCNKKKTNSVLLSTKHFPLPSCRQKTFTEISYDVSYFIFFLKHLRC